MQTTIYIQLTFDVIGDDAIGAAQVIAQHIDSGMLDGAFLAAIRDEFPNDAGLPQLDGDWRIRTVTTSATVGEVPS